MQTEITIRPAGTTIHKAVVLTKYFSNFIFRIIFFAVWLLGVCSILVLGSSFLYHFDLRIIGLCLLLLAVFLVYLAFRKFFIAKVRRPRISLSEAKKRIAEGKIVNLYALFSYDFAASTEKMYGSKDAVSETMQNLALAVMDTREINFILLRLGLGKEDIINIITSNYPSSTSTTNLIAHALDLAIIANRKEISAVDVFWAFCDSDAFFQGILKNLRLNADDIANIVHWQATLDDKVDENEGVFNYRRFKMTGGIGRDWVFGYTNFLRMYSMDLTESIREYGLSLEVIAREKEIREIEEALLSQANGNVIMVGDAGIGKRTIILGFVKNLVNGNLNPTLNKRHIFQLDIESLLSGEADPGALMEKVGRVFSETASAGNVILYIENIDNLFSGDTVGKANLSEVILPYLDSNEIHIVGSCDVAGYNNTILPNGALAKRFVKVTVREPDDKAMVSVLEDTIPTIEYQTKAIVSYEAIKAAIKAASKYILNQPNPEKSIGLIDGAVTRAVAARGETIILPADIESYIAEKYDLPTGDVAAKEQEILLNLEQKMHALVIGQAMAVDSIANALRRARAKVTDTHKPIGSFLFLGPTGVGKTATAKALANVYFGGEAKMIRYDMSEYQNKDDIYRLIGSRTEQGNLTTAVRENPFSLLLFDEIEKAEPDILNLFLQILDEGLLTDGEGKKVSFANTIIIATSNAGSELIYQSIKEGIDFSKVSAKLTSYIVDQHLFRAELLNRFSAVIAFAPLSQAEIVQIAKLMIDTLKKTIQETQGIEITVAEDAIAYLSELGFDPEMGARPMQRVIEEKLENLLADKVLRGELKEGDKYQITLEMIK
ncbi:MAG: AAA family ATPase [Candidatus Berkelbacteria bacterium]